MSDDRAPIDLDALESELRASYGNGEPIGVDRGCALDLIAECRRLRAKIERVERETDGMLRTSRLTAHGLGVRWAAVRIQSRISSALADTEEPT